MLPRLSDSVLAAARRLGLTGTDEELEAEIGRRYVLSVPFSHPDMRRRYEDIAFKLDEDGFVAALAGVFTADPTSRRSMKVLCTDCCADGDFCSGCDSRGFVSLPAFALREGNLLYERDSQLD